MNEKLGSCLQVDVLCVGAAAYDLTFSVAAHPGPDEKLFATGLVGCGGGPAANGAVAVARLGGTAVFAGYLGDDQFGELHLAELEAEGVRTDWIVRGGAPTPVSTILAQPDGRRALIAYQGDTPKLPAGSIDFSTLKPRVILFDGHEPHISRPLVKFARANGIPTILDAGSRHLGTEQLADQVDYLICSVKFARQMTGEQDPEAGLNWLRKNAPNVVVTDGAQGLFWARGEAAGHLSAFTVPAVDSTGAGDTFHGAFSWCVARGKRWRDSLRFASAAAALCCTRYGARPGIPEWEAVQDLLKKGTQDVG
jgi:sulfofructose kinase